MVEERCIHEVIPGTNKRRCLFFHATRISLIPFVGKPPGYEQVTCRSMCASEVALFMVVHVFIICVYPEQRWVLADKEWIWSDPIPSLGFPCIFVIALSLFIFLQFPLLNIALFRRDYSCFQCVSLPWPAGNEPNNTVVNPPPPAFLALLWVIEVLLFVSFLLLHVCWNVTSCRLVGEYQSVEGTAVSILRVEVRRVWENCVEDGHCQAFSDLLHTNGQGERALFVKRCMRA